MRREGCAASRNTQALYLRFDAGFGLLDGAEKVRQCVVLRATFFEGRGSTVG